MEQTAFTVPGTLKHTAETEAELIKEMRTYVSAQPGVRFLADVLTALHATGGLRDPAAFYASFPPSQVLQALAQRPDLRVRLVRAITGGPPALLRRQSPADLASQIELLVAEDLPAAERVLRAEEDRQSSVIELYFKYLDTTDVATYLPAGALWQYEGAGEGKGKGKGHDGWWTREASPVSRAMMAAELKSIRRHGIVNDTEILDLIGNEAFERDLPLGVRTELRTAARKAARDGRPFRDSDLFACLPAGEGKRDLTDELCESVSLLALRKVVDRAAEVLGWTPKVEAAVANHVEAAVAPVAGPSAVVEGAPARGAGKPGGNLFTSARTPEPVAKTPPPLVTRPLAAAKPAAAAKAAPAKPSEPAVASDRRASQQALTAVSGEDILMAVDVPFAEDHLPNFTEIGDSDAIEEQSRG
jgi:hypothetical protein